MFTNKHTAVIRFFFIVGDACTSLQASIVEVLYRFQTSTFIVPKFMTAHICFITHQSLMHIILSHVDSASRCVPATLLQLRMPGERTRPLGRLLKPMRPSGSTSRLGFLLALACLEQASFSSLTHTTAHQQHRATYRTTLLSRALCSQKNS